MIKTYVTKAIFVNQSYPIEQIFNWHKINLKCPFFTVFFGVFLSYFLDPLWSYFLLFGSYFLPSIEEIFVIFSLFYCIFYCHGKIFYRGDRKNTIGKLQKIQ